MNPIKIETENILYVETIQVTSLVEAAQALSFRAKAMLFPPSSQEVDFPNDKHCHETYWHYNTLIVL